jgi:fructose-bisphosphate aldolase class II
MQEILRDAFARRYGVGAFNIVNDVTMQAVLAAAAETRSPVIIQVSVKTVKQLGAQLIQQMFQDFARRVPIPATLHLDHCPERAMIEECVAAGWNSVLFDASDLTYAENLAQTTAVVALAHRQGVAVEGELEAVEGVEDDVGSDDAGAVVPLEQAVAFMRTTKIDSFAPAIGTAHGVYRREPKINFRRVEEIVAAEPLPIVLHGGTGLKDDVFRDLIRLGAVKVNISTQLKITYTEGLRKHLNAHPAQHDPAKLHDAVKRDVQAMAAGYMQVFGSAGKAP